MNKSTLLHNYLSYCKSILVRFQAKKKQIANTLLFRIERSWMHIVRLIDETVRAVQTVCPFGVWNGVGITP